MTKLSLTGAGALALLAAAPTQAAGISSFYDGKTVNMYIGYSVGGGYDVYARLVARHMARHIPGAAEIVPNNMPGAGSLRMTNWLKENKINILVQLSMKKHPDLPNVPLVLDLAKTQEERQMLRLVFARQAMGRPFMAPPGVPEDRVKILRDAFMATMKDKEFLAEAAKGQLEIDPVPGEEVQDIVREAYAMPADLVKRVAAMVK